jgi:putative ABC transport system substrate-binding protein
MGTPRAIREKTTTIPILLTASLDPIGERLAQSLRRPGMNVTGIALSLDQLAAKHIELIQEIRPRRNRFSCVRIRLSSGHAKVAPNV